MAAKDALTRVAPLIKVLGNSYATVTQHKFAWEDFPPV